MASSPSSVTGVDASHSDLGELTSSQISRGRYLSSGNRPQAVLSQTYADQNDLSVGDAVKVGGKSLKVVGISKAPLGGQSSDIYVPLGVLQKVSDHAGRINTVSVRADSASQVSTVSSEIQSSFSGADVTTAKDLASRVTGSLESARNLSRDLGTALAVIALIAATLIASLLTLSSVSKRTREIGTLKAIGWRNWRVVRQISGEATAQGLIGGLAGAALGIGGAALIGALGVTLDATVGQSGAAPGPFGQGIASGSSSVTLGAPVSLGVIALAVALAMAAGLVAGLAGASRAARLRPAEALRSVE